MIQRQGEEEEPAAKLIQRQGEEEEPAAKLIQRQGEEEEPAAKLIQRQGEEEEPAAKLIQRQGEEEEPAAKLIQQKKEEESSDDKADTGMPGEKMDEKEMLEQLIQQTKGAGMPLPDDIRMEMEQQFMADFSKVRIHTDKTAIKMSAILSAQAFTHGYDIYFNKRKYDPYSQEGKRLLAHELTHVVQQKG